MKRIIITVMITAMVGIFTTVVAQAPIDDGIRRRSMELERIKRQAESDGKTGSNTEKRVDFAKVKMAFEGIQLQQDLVVEAYTRNENIDYRQINKSSRQITRMAKSLKANLFSLPGNLKSGDKKLIGGNKKTVKELIVELDSAIGRLVTNPIFHSLSVVEPEELNRSLSDLDEIIDLSGVLALQSRISPL